MEVGIPSTLPASAGAFFGALLETGYMIPLVKGLEVLVGIALLANRWVALALTVFAPVIVNVVAFHLFLAPAGLAPGILLAGMTIFLAWRHRDAYRGMLLPSRSARLSNELPNTELAAAA